MRCIIFNFLSYEHKNNANSEKFLFYTSVSVFREKAQKGNQKT
jgi:hypothetical protein